MHKLRYKDIFPITQFLQDPPGTHTHTHSLANASNFANFLPSYPFVTLRITVGIMLLTGEKKSDFSQFFCHLSKHMGGGNHHSSLTANAP